MPKREQEDLTLHSLWLYRGDYQKLQELFGDKLPAAKVIRVLVRNVVNKAEAGRAEASQPIDHKSFDVQLSAEDLKEDAGPANI